MREIKMRFKRSKPYSFPQHASSSKKFRRGREEEEEGQEEMIPELKSSDHGRLRVTVSDLSPECTVLELKSRFQMFGDVSRVRIDRSLSVGYVNFRSEDSANAAMSEARDPSAGIFVRSQKVQLSWSSDPIPQWKAGVGLAASSKLLRAQIPLSKHGRGNKKVDTNCVAETVLTDRQIIAYDDLL